MPACLSLLTAWRAAALQQVGGGSLVAAHTWGKEQKRKFL